MEISLLLWKIYHSWDSLCPNFKCSYLIHMGSKKYETTCGILFCTWFSGGLFWTLKHGSGGAVFVTGCRIARIALKLITWETIASQGCLLHESLLLHVFANHTGTCIWASLQRWKHRGAHHDCLGVLYAYVKTCYQYNPLSSLCSISDVFCTRDHISGCYWVVHCKATR
jgi:hypothetical protein